MNKIEQREQATPHLFDIGVSERTGMWLIVMIFARRWSLHGNPTPHLPKYDDPTVGCALQIFISGFGAPKGVLREGAGLEWSTKPPAS
jgi:hypothetical protein